MSGGPQAQMQGPLAHIWLDLMRPVCLYVSHILRIPLNLLQIAFTSLMLSGDQCHSEASAQRKKAPHNKMCFIPLP